MCPVVEIGSLEDNLYLLFQIIENQYRVYTNLDPKIIKPETKNMIN